ncbi:MAG TPA: DUF6352 family protein [Casimicrobiaceae bacterium]
MPDFWSGCDYRLLAPREDGRLEVTDRFLARYLARPELAPIADSCAAELALHAKLAGDPRASVAADELAAIADADARANYAIWLRFRDRLTSAESLEAAYVALFRGEGVDVPPEFVAELTQILLRHILGDAADPIAARTAEMLFRPQKIAITEDGTVMAADEATVERFAEGTAFGSLGELLAKNRVPTRSIDLDVLSRDNAELYWERDERHDLAISLNRGQPAHTALMRVIETWIAHFLGARVEVRSEREITEDPWAWHVGLDAEASGLLNDLYRGDEVDEGRMRRLLALFRLDFADPADMRTDVAGRPVWLAMAMDDQQLLRMKPQNLLVNLPLARTQ